MTDFRITLPWPDKSLFINRSNGRHWATRQPAKRAARAAAKWQSVGCDIGDNTIDHSVVIIVNPPDKKRRDIDGILSALKPTLDGLADGLQTNDFHFNPITILRGETFIGGRVSITIEARI